MVDFYKWMEASGKSLDLSEGSKKHASRSHAYPAAYRVAANAGEDFENGLALTPGAADAITYMSNHKKKKKKKKDD